MSQRLVLCDGREKADPLSNNIPCSRSVAYSNECFELNDVLRLEKKDHSTCVLSGLLVRTHWHGGEFKRLGCL
ncbi:hypothetical protein TNCT_491451 [Trichonephila clavata]|uniref:Uncharacterized protein n=1 Tax=Trichonephila clavata TaxID=2740835 RepID=A0A8X6KHP3_TRICU|nr:hypothetical protein TNCT_491451 [Trichonephila clavata]